MKKQTYKKNEKTNIKKTNKQIWNKTKQKVLSTIMIK